jgi:DNA-binding transcriptional regulator YiaG
MTRDEFASCLGVTAEAVKGWEQGRRNPGGSANILLQQLGEQADEKRKVVESNAKIGRAVLRGKP